METFELKPGIRIFHFTNIPDFTTNVILVERSGTSFLIDTYCGPSGLSEVLEWISPEKRLIVINTHFHWDHVWGNCAFPGAMIIGHKLCRELIRSHWEEQWQVNKAYTLGEVRMLLPGVTFRESLVFEEEELELFYSPGHTLDSISVFDHHHRILFPGDNLERPIVYVEQGDVDLYIRTLEGYRCFKADQIVGSHTISLEDGDIAATIAYLDNLRKGRSFSPGSEYEERVHRANLKVLFPDIPQ